MYHPRMGQVLFVRQVWASRSPSPGHPMRVDGVVCTSRLSWLAHTLGHEMLHVMLACMCSAHASNAPANMALEGHGANFLILNWFLLGHRGHTYADRGWSMASVRPDRF